MDVTATCTHLHLGPLEAWASHNMSCRPIAGGATCEAMLSLAVCETGQQSVRCFGLQRVFNYAKGADDPMPDIGIHSAAAAIACPLSRVLHACSDR